MLALIILAVLFLVTVAYATWLYRQGSFPKSRLRRNAKRAARRAWELNREDAKRERHSERKPTQRNAS
jgi:hypothetical protein